MRQTVLGYEKKFFINGTQISGVQSIEGSYGIQEKPINVIGWGHVNQNFNNLHHTLITEEEEHEQNESFVLTEK